LIEALEDKTGLIRRDGLGRRVDRSARLVITPNPGLQWDHAGIPTTALLELMGDLVTSWMESRSEEEKTNKPLTCLARGSWLRPTEDPDALRNARPAIQ